jgi:hypothetical protein
MGLEQVEHAGELAYTSGIDSSIEAALGAGFLRAASVRYCGVRMPATTSSPCALIRYSP